MPPRAFRWLLHLLPREFRERYGRDMEAAFEADRRSAAGRGAALETGRLWMATVVDLLRTAPGEHLEILGRDVRVALRGWRSRPVPTAAAVAALAIGIGANVATFAVVDAVLLAPLDYRDADRLVSVKETSRGEPSNLGYLSFVDTAGRARAFTDLVAASQSTATFSEGDQPAERVNGMRVSRQYFDMVGVRPRLGRPFSDAEDRPGEARRVAILSDGLWRRRFAADPGVIGRRVLISDVPMTVVGVMPPGVDDLIASRLYRGAEVWFPLGYDPAAPFACRTCRHLAVFGRLAPGVSAAAAEREVSDLFAEFERAHPTEYTQAAARVVPLREVFLGPVRPALFLLWAGVALLLLVACANVASLQLLRASERTADVAVRAALGVTRGRLARLFVTESVLLSAAGTLAGLAPAWAAVRLIATSGPRELPRLASAALDGRAIAVAVGIAVASGLVFAVVPLRRLSRGATSDALHGAGRRTEGTGAWRFRAGLVAANVAMAAVLLAGAAALTRNVQRILAVEPGFEPGHVLTLRLWAGGARFTKGEPSEAIATAVTFYTDLLDRVRALPGVETAAGVTTLPLGGGVDAYGLHIVGRFTANPEDAPMADRFVVTPGFFETLRVPLQRGRYLGAGDGAGATRVAVINRAAADELFPGEDPLGHQVVLGGQQGDPRTIVGIVGDVRHQGLDRPAGIQVYVPQAQWAWAETLMTLVVRTAGDPLALARPVREAVLALDRSQPVTDIEPYDTVVAATTGTRRFVATGLTVFGLLALLLAVVGLYGALSVSVEQRRLEIGIRLALGARAGEVRGMVLSRGLRPVALGLGLGALAVAGASRLAAAQGYPAGTDPGPLVGALALLAAAGVLACLVPAWRAGHVDPARSLRAE
ncbi:MAG: ABC transporter permease [Vicinamibacterales bacterium]